MDTFEEIVEELNRHLTSENQNWLFGAGISCEANIPLMVQLTRRVESELPDGRLKDLYNNIAGDLDEHYHIEHVLSHIGDYIALSERSRHKRAEINGDTYSMEEFNDLHSVLIANIRETIRYGFREADTEIGISEMVGSINNPIVDIKNHRNFAKVLLSSRANLLTRSSIYIFSTNYDTLMEDALGLEKVKVNDGFTNAAIGFWNPNDSFNSKSGINVIKLHGSVDWVKDSNDGLIRNRYGVNYLNQSSNVLIYPQATKYIETQRDPFAKLFSIFRSRLNSPVEHLLIAAGYSFGDYHINYEIDSALKSSGNKTTLIVFIDKVNEVLSGWMKDPCINKKVFVATGKGVCHCSDIPVAREGSEGLDWWKFSKLIGFLKDGEIV